jgi:uncharacterized protein (TIGR04222 family)
MNFVLLVGSAAAVAVAVVVAVVLRRRASTVKAADLPDLHPIDLGYLNGGAGLAAVVACVGLHERGMLVRSTSASAGLEMAFARDRDRHPVEQAVAAAVAAEVAGRGLVAALQAVPAMVDVRDDLARQGLLARRLGRHSCSRSGRTLVMAASAAVAPRSSDAVGGADATAPGAATDVAGGATGSPQAARRVALLGSEELFAVAPALARALGAFPQPGRVRWDAGTVVSRSIRRRATNRGRMALGENSGDTTVSSGYYIGGLGNHGGLP